MTSYLAQKPLRKLFKEMSRIVGIGVVHFRGDGPVMITAWKVKETFLFVRYLYVAKMLRRFILKKQKKAE